MLLSGINVLNGNLLKKAWQIGRYSRFIISGDEVKYFFGEASPRFLLNQYSTNSIGTSTMSAYSSPASIMSSSSEG